MTNCPDYKLLNPSDSPQCDCGYDFKTKAVVKLDRSEWRYLKKHGGKRP